MQKYELTIVLPGKASANKKKKTEKFVEELLKTFGGKSTKKEDWGVINLAYRINKSEKGLFLYFEFSMEPASVKQLDDKLRLEEDIIRYLLVTSKKQ